MTYVSKSKNLQINRRISLSFRDAALYRIFEDNIRFTANLTQRIKNGEQDSIILDCLETCLETYHKSLNFDFVAVILNETADEQSSTQIPASWTKFVEDQNTISALFDTVNSALNQMLFQKDQAPQKLKKICNLALRCIAEYANIRTGYFTNNLSRSAYYQNLINNLS